MNNIPIYFQKDVFNDTMCQRFFNFNKEDRNSFKTKMEEILNLLEPYIVNYFKLLLENQNIYRNQLEKKKFFIDNLHFKEFKATNEKNSNCQNFVAKNIFNFIIFLNDLDPQETGGEFVFNNTTTIKCKKGCLIIFPNEWFFSFDNKNPSTGVKYCLEGQIFIQ